MPTRPVLLSYSLYIPTMLLGFLFGVPISALLHAWLNSLLPVPFLSMIIQTTDTLCGLPSNSSDNISTNYTFAYLNSPAEYYPYQRLLLGGGYTPPSAKNVGTQSSVPSVEA